MGLLDLGRKNQQANNQLPNKSFEKPEKVSPDAHTNAATAPQLSEKQVEDKKKADEAAELAKTTTKPKKRQRNKKKVVEHTACGGTGLVDPYTLCAGCNGSGTVKA